MMAFMAVIKTPKVCKMMAFMALVLGLGLSFYILLGSIFRGAFYLHRVWGLGSKLLKGGSVGNCIGDYSRNYTGYQG